MQSHRHLRSSPGQAPGRQLVFCFRMSINTFWRNGSVVEKSSSKLAGLSWGFWNEKWSGYQLSLAAHMLFLLLSARLWRPTSDGALQPLGHLFLHRRRGKGSTMVLSLLCSWRGWSLWKVPQVRSSSSALWQVATDRLLGGLEKALFLFSGLCFWLAGACQSCLPEMACFPGGLSTSKVTPARYGCQPLLGKACLKACVQSLRVNCPLKQHNTEGKSSIQ